MSFSRNNDSLNSTRKTWTIKMGASYLDGLLDGKINFFRLRIKYWEYELEDAQTLIKKHKPKAAVFDDDDPGQSLRQLNARVTTCNYKLSDYRAKLKEAEDWQIFFSTAGGGDEFQVTLEDALYFGLREYVKSHGA